MIDAGPPKGVPCGGLVSHATDPAFPNTCQPDKKKPGHGSAVAGL